MEPRLRLLLFVAAAICSVSAQPSEELTRLCNSQTRCGDCILASPDCNWCASQTFNGTARCYPTGGETSCSEEDTQNPAGGVQEQAEEDFSGLNQISPSRLSVTLRPGQPLNVDIAVQPANNFPVDLYLLMDLSFSMSDDLDNLKMLGADIADNIMEISSNFSIGFGSFVDKVLSPYVNLNPFRLADPCLDGCVRPYSYRHVITLTNDTNRFSALVQEQVISGNQDSPEGGFDGFLQSIVCPNVIGWREISRKLLLFITDAGFHMAGDGKLAGVIRPNDGLCKISPQPSAEFVEYNDWDVQDYPSVGQIAESLRDFGIIPIFAAEENALPIYERLAQEIGVAYTGTLESDSSNVVDLVTDLYNEISQRIVFDPNPVDGVSFNITPSSCPGPIDSDGFCTGVQIDQVANFSVGITLNECTPAFMEGPQIAVVNVAGFGSFEVEITAICQCPCEAETAQAPDPNVCNGNGTLVCGICDCNPGSFGDECQCTAAQVSSVQDCPLGPNDVQCTGRGTCTCGQCDCDTDRNNMPLFAGRACECDLNALCSRSIRDERCSGRGTCSCDGCRCNIEPNTGTPYFGEFCECTPDTDCVDPFNSTSICNGRGTCSCPGTCECEEGPYFGDYCELCSGDPVCFDNGCTINLDCAICIIEYAASINEDVPPEIFFLNETVVQGDFSVLGGRLDLYLNTVGAQFDTSARCSSVCASEFIALINGTDTVDYRIDGDLTSRCEYEDSNRCIYRYYVPNPLLDEGPLLTNDILSIAAIDIRTLPIHVEYEGVCPEASRGPRPWVIAIGIIIPLLVLGLLALLLLKLLLILLDHIEVRKFERELARTKYTKNENPLYRSANKEYKNPIYGK